MNKRFKARRRQSGAALVVLLALVLLVSAAILLNRFDSEASVSVDRDKADSGALADAKAALIAWSATYAPSAARQSAPGTLPFPDRNGDGDYDGMSDCDALGASDLVLVGRLPQLGESVVSDPLCLVNNPLNVDFRDGDGEPLWYAVSRNVLPGVGVGGGPINPDMGGAGRMAYPWIQLRDSQGAIINDPNTGAPLAVAAVIFAPGRVIGAQTRGGAAATANYLDRVDILGTTYDNADADGCPDNLTAPCAGFELEEFVVHPNPQSADAFNDRLVYITVDELMRAVEKRVLGETALALDAYRLAGWNGGNVYPWLAGFRNPRAGSSGTATGGSATQLSDAGADFIADGVEVGDLIVNTSDGGSGVITAVAATTINFAALLGGTQNDFSAGENYQVEPSFKTTLPPVRTGQLPVHRPNEIFATSFYAHWDISSVDETGTGSPFSLIPDDNEIQNNPPENEITVTSNNGRCLWTEAKRVDCVGTQVIPSFWRSDLGKNVIRTIQVSISFTGDSVTITPPTAGDVRRRSVSIGVPSGTSLTDATAQPPPLLPRNDWFIIVTDQDGADVASMEIELNSSNGWIEINNIRYDLSVVYNDIDDPVTANPLDPWDEVPEWFAENDWHHFIYASFSPDRVVGGNADLDNNCTTPTNSCLKTNIGGTAARTDIPALLISSGVQWTNQDRGIGDCDGDGGGPLTDPTDDSFLCAYLDGDTSLYDVSTDVLRHGANTVTITTDWYAGDLFSAGFNDQIRVIE